jgi:hypothetical protein
MINFIIWVDLTVLPLSLHAGRMQLLIMVYLPALATYLTFGDNDFLLNNNLSLTGLDIVCTHPYCLSGSNKFNSRSPHSKT